MSSLYVCVSVFLSVFSAVFWRINVFIVRGRHSEGPLESGLGLGLGLVVGNNPRCGKTKPEFESKTNHGVCSLT